MNYIFLKCSWRPLIYLLFCLNLTTAHIRMVCPRPVSPRSDIATVTIDAGGGGKNKCLVGDESEQDVMEVHPGLFTIRFEETKFMAGSPFRIMLYSASFIEGHTPETDHGKRDLRRQKRDANGMTTESSISFQDLINLVNGTLNSMDVDSNGSVSNQDAVKKLNDTDEKLSANNNTASTPRFESSTASTTESKNMPEDSTTQGSEDTRSDPDSRGKSEPSTNAQDQSCVLLDHIPHNDQAVISDKCSNQKNAFPLGICEESTYYVTIRIPDLFCPDCFLVVQQVEANPDHKVCDVSSGNESECISYISCSRISIRPSLEGMNRNLSYCSNYIDNLPDDWAYRPQDIYKAGDHAVLTMDILHGDLHIEIMRGLKIGPTEKVEIHFDRKIIWSSTMIEGHLNADSVLMVWTSVADKYQAALKAKKLVLNIVGSKMSQALNIVFQDQIFSEGNISILHDIYSNHGWLIANRFLGPTAKDPMAALPVGPCVPPARHFLAFFEAVDAGDHGLLGMTLLENRAYITAVLHVQLGTVQSIRFRGSELVGAEDIVVKVPETFSGVFQVALDVGQQMKFIDSVQFLKSVEVKTNREDAIMVGDLEEGFYTVLRDQRGRVRGMGAFQPTQGYWMRAEIVLSDLSNVSPKVKSARLLGSHVELMDLSKETVHCTQEFCCLETYVPELSSEFFLHLMSGQARVEVITDMDDMSGQIVGSHNCSRFGGLCLMTNNLSKNNALTEKFGGTVNAVMLLDRAGVLEISVQVNHPDWGLTDNNNYTADLISHDGLSIKIPLQFSWITEELYTAKEKYSLTNSKKKGRLFHEQDKQFHLKMSNGIHTLMSDNVHGLIKKECIQSKIHVVGKNKNFWSPLSAPFDLIYAVVLDHVKFMFDDNTTSLYLMASKASFEKCNFTKAKKIKASSAIGGMSVYFYKLTSPGRFYFADKDSCPSHAPAKLTIQVVKGKESLVQDRNRENWCRTSFYTSWRQDELEKWEPPSVAGPIVLGLFLGLTTGIGFLLWQGMKMKQTPIHSVSTSRNSLSHFVRF